MAGVEGRLEGGTVCAEFQFPLAKLFEQTNGAEHYRDGKILCGNIHTAQRNYCQFT